MHPKWQTCPDACAGHGSLVQPSRGINNEYGKDISNYDLIYIPSEDFSGTDEFSFYLSMSEQSQESVSGEDGEYTTFTVIVTPVNDPPLALGLDDFWEEKMIIDQIYKVSTWKSRLDMVEDVPQEIFLTGFDPDGDPLSFEIVSQPSHGTITEVDPSYPSSEHDEHCTEFIYDNGTDKTVCGRLYGEQPDNYFYSSFGSSPHPPGHQTATFVYTPDSNYSTKGSEYSDSFTYKVNDGTFDSENFSRPEIPLNYGFGSTKYDATPTIEIFIEPVNDIPIANTGSSKTVDIDSVVQLDGSQSSDVDGDSLTYSWIQTSGYPVMLTADNIAKPQFTASQDGQLIFMLTVNDGISTSNPSIINISVKPNFELVYIIVAAVAVSGGIGAIVFMKKRSKAPTVVQQESPSRRQTTVLFCSNCGNGLKPEAKFCGSCGIKV